MREWNSGLKVTGGKGRKCAYCNRRFKGAYRIVDGMVSCERCNRNIDPSVVTSLEKQIAALKREKGLWVQCPICGGSLVLPAKLPRES
jgi:hypothetical protein